MKYLISPEKKQYKANLHSHSTFSDGKLLTRISDARCSFVLETLREMGAPEDITLQAKPHVGTDKLRNIVKSIRKGSMTIITYLPSLRSILLVRIMIRFSILSLLRMFFLIQMKRKLYPMIHRMITLYQSLKRMTENRLLIL